ncbi:MAG TPA: response regulator [Verrucomicrobiae bacterium]|jgi:hypothetical protein|nr:response regulator [Verrucomicrobiae bacterium]
MDKLSKTSVGLFSDGAAIIRILHLEDSNADAEFVQHMLEKEGIRCQVAQVPDQPRYEAALRAGEFDLILCDHGLPGYNGFAALDFARKIQPATPVIVLSGTMDEEQAVESLKNGATDYILKQRLARLVPAVRRALQDAGIRKVQLASQRRILEQANLLNLTRDAIVVRSMDDRILSWNRGAELMFGWKEEEAVDQNFAELTHANPALFRAAALNLAECGDWLGEFELRNKGGEEISVFSRWSLLRDVDGQPQSILSAYTDVTEKKKMEAIFLRAQRMDSIGALAGGIAHDLNNALAPVLMSADLLRQCEDNTSRERFLDIISSSAQRATGMVKQILGFARGSRQPIGPIMLTHAVRDMAKIVRETFPKSITISVNLPDKDLWQVQGDATELHQLLLNLCVNARDAMPNGGQLKLSARNLMVQPDESGVSGHQPGPYVVIAVSDTGTGIPPEVLPRIFDPFFTTKLPDKGTGLGLSTVASIVKNYGGFIDIKTEAGKGTEFQMHLPAIPTAPPIAASAEEPALPVGHGELILVVDDEEAVCELAKSTLESYGYRVITAQNGVHGLASFEAHKNEIRLLVTDTDMPVLDGMTAVRAIKQMRPDLPVIVASGGARDTEELRHEDSALKRLAKPFSLEQLLIAVDLAIQH